ncbi:apoptosis-enhancing nuclease [Thalassophryne amazonica]|uniref:apoptosis-enhancing nuclease n=1 Tax=Thalassophryne amazonica TaxID=390379 RepID=UPI0014714EE4|nr:apoptosis-enhancing nuclease [Thalassophryne amazonica]
MAMSSKRSESSSRGLLNNYRYLCKKTMRLQGVENHKTRRKFELKTTVSRVNWKRTDQHSQPLDTNRSECGTKQQTEAGQQHRRVSHSSAFLPKADSQSLVSALRDTWDVDSGFSETSPPVSGRSSPCLSFCPTKVVAMDCEMVGTGPSGRCSELARCSILDYHGNILYDKYVLPCQPVTDYRTRWSGIQQHHLYNATPYAQAREEILSVLNGRVVVGHSIFNDFRVLEMDHPAHMIRDTSTTRLLSCLAGFPGRRCSSLKKLASKLLNRKIQVGKKGHCSVEDAQASLDLYKLVEGEWEQELHNMLSDDAPQPSFTSSSHYMQDEYWPDDIIADSP